MKKDTRGSAVVVYVLVLAVAALLAPKVAPKLFDSRTKEAVASASSTNDLLDASNKKAAAQTASAVVIGEAAADLPASPNRSFILNEVPVMLARGPAPDPKQLLAARDRRIAFLEGKLEAQQEQTKSAMKDAASLNAKLASAIEEKHATDTALLESAAVSRGKDMALSAVIFIAVLLLVAYFRLRSNSLHFSQVGEIKALAMKGEHSVDQIFDAVVNRSQWDKVKKFTDKHFTSDDFKK